MQILSATFRFGGLSCLKFVTPDVYYLQTHNKLQDIQTVGATVQSAKIGELQLIPFAGAVGGITAIKDVEEMTDERSKFYEDTTFIFPYCLKCGSWRLAMILNYEDIICIECNAVYELRIKE